MLKSLLRRVLPVLLLPLFILPAAAVTIQAVTTKSGLTAWLVEDHTIPLIAMNFAFAGGSASDPAGKEGAAHYLTGMLDEGAADMDSPTFQARRDELGMKLSFDDDQDRFTGSFQTLSRNRDAAFALLKAAVTAPHFAEEPMERVRQQFLTSVRDEGKDPGRLASLQFTAMALPGHPYARNDHGTEATIQAMTTADLRAAHQRLFTRRGMLISVVGDIDAATLGQKLDEAFGSLPDTEPPAPPPEATVASGPALKLIGMDMPQSLILFGGPGLLRKDQDFIPAYVMNQILGGSGLGSRLSTVVREKNGLTYGIDTGLLPLRRAGYFIGSFSTRNEKAGEAMALVRQELARMAQDGPTQQELDQAKTYLTGSYALRFDSNAKIAAQLLAIQQDNLGIDYINRRNSLVEAVTMDQVKEQAKRLLHPDQLLLSVVGRPKGL